MSHFTAACDCVNINHRASDSAGRLDLALPARAIRLSIARLKRYAEGKVFAGSGLALIRSSVVSVVWMPSYCDSLIRSSVVSLVV